ncbi:AraC family transcriptional regulator [Secundilactobacillus paracollinoides]|nr:AraC family transcriptional regulator [Secundilactobacillus paracollinoides]
MAYSDASHFSREFKKHFGVAPRAWSRAWSKAL